MNSPGIIINILPIEGLRLTSRVLRDLPIKMATMYCMIDHMYAVARLQRHCTTPLLSIVVYVSLASW